MDCGEVVFSGHAVRRMFERRISRDDVVQAVAAGEVIAEYLDDTPFPSFLILATVNRRVFHLVVAEDGTGRKCHVVTVYLPDPDLWNPDFKTRRSS
jgi:hypothetical protein